MGVWNEFVLAAQKALHESLHNIDELVNGSTPRAEAMKLVYICEEKIKGIPYLDLLAKKMGKPPSEIMELYKEAKRLRLPIDLRSQDGKDFFVVRFWDRHSLVPRKRTKKKFERRSMKKLKRKLTMQRTGAG